MSEYVTTTATIFSRTGLIKEGSFRVTRSATPPPPAEENWERAQRFAGPPTRIRVLVSEAATSWSVQAGELIDAPKELADILIRKKHARLARPDEPLTFAPIE
jgi:hypothetical protein